MLWRLSNTIDTEESSHQDPIQQDNGQLTEHNSQRLRLNSLLQRLPDSSIAAQQQLEAKYRTQVLIERDIHSSGSSFEQDSVYGHDSQHVKGVSRKVQIETRTPISNTIMFFKGTSNISSIATHQLFNTLSLFAMVHRFLTLCLGRPSMAWQMLWVSSTFLQLDVMALLHVISFPNTPRSLPQAWFQVMKSQVRPNVSLMVVKPSTVSEIFHARISEQCAYQY